MVEILIVGTNEPIMETIARLINKDGIWNATIAFSFKEACTTCSVKQFKLALVGAGFSDEEEIQLKKHFNNLKPTLKMVKHYGGGSGLLFAEIHQALNV